MTQMYAYHRKLINKVRMLQFILYRSIHSYCLNHSDLTQTSSPHYRCQVYLVGTTISLQYDSLLLEWVRGCHVSTCCTHSTLGDENKRVTINVEYRYDTNLHTDNIKHQILYLAQQLSFIYFYVRNITYQEHPITVEPLTSDLYLRGTWFESWTPYIRPPRLLPSPAFTIQWLRPHHPPLYGLS